MNDLKIEKPNNNKELNMKNLSGLMNDLNNQINTSLNDLQGMLLSHNINKGL